MQLSNDTSKNSTSPPYLVKNERSLRTKDPLFSTGNEALVKFLGQDSCFQDFYNI